MVGRVVEGKGSGDRVVKGQKAGRRADEEKPNDPGADQAKDQKAEDESQEKESHDDGEERRPGDEERNPDESVVNERVGVVEDRKGKEESEGRERSLAVAGNGQLVGEVVEEDGVKGRPRKVDTIAIVSYAFPLTNDTDNQRHHRPLRNKLSLPKPLTLRKKMSKQWQLHRLPNR